MIAERSSYSNDKYSFPSRLWSDVFAEEAWDRFYIRLKLLTSSLGICDAVLLINNFFSIMTWHPLNPFSTSACKVHTL